MDFASTAQRALNLWTDRGEPPKWLGTFFNHWLPQLVTLVLVLMLAKTAADLSWRIIPAPAEKPVITQQQSIRATPSQNAEDSAGMARKISDLHLFGVANAVKPTVVKQIDQKAPETKLNLTLHGVFMEEKPELGAAIIGKAGASQNYYKVGDLVMSGVKLQGVFADRVILDRNGTSEVLRFPKTSSSVAVDGNQRAPSSRTAAQPGSLKSYHDIFKNEPLKIFEHVRFVPVRSGQNLKGYRVLPQRDRKLYNKLGVRPSDLITAVNGVSVTNEKEAMSLLGKLNDMQQLDLTILRKGRQETITLNLN
jgi:general secretion pathway protein C